jgi:hypothetical protein
MSFYGIVLIVTILMLSLYLGVFLGEMSSATGIANAYSMISESMLQAAGTIIR